MVQKLTIPNQILTLTTVFFCAFVFSSSISLAETKADSVVVNKAARELLLYNGEDLLKKYKVALGDNPIGHKEQEGDERTPEGSYVIDYRNPKSRFFLSLHITYPNEQDKEKARQAGVSPGGDIFIHGLGKGFGWLGHQHLRSDWTDGCIAVTNEEIQEIWDLVPNGTPIQLNP